MQSIKNQSKENQSGDSQKDFSIGNPPQPPVKK
jgi:hypothetical protein